MTLTDQRPGSLPDQIRFDEHRWSNLQAPVYLAFLAAVRTLDATDRASGHSLLEGLARVAERANGANRGSLAFPWQGPARELGHVVELAIPDAGRREAFAAQMAARGHALHLAGKP